MGCGSSTKREVSSPSDRLESKPEPEPGNNKPSQEETPKAGSRDSGPSAKDAKKRETNAATSRFFETRAQHTYYTLEDSQTIKESLTISVGADHYSIFFPTGFKSVKTEEVLTDEKLDSIVEMAKEDTQMDRQLSGIMSTIEVLKQSKSKEAVIRSYTDDGLYYIFNQYVRYGDYIGLKLFREYIFCLKGSLIELGTPVTTKTTAYRGMSLPKDVVDKWKELTNNFGLFSAFTSTSLQQSIVKGFMQPKPGQVGVLMSVELTDSTSEFCDYLDKFDFIEDCGIFYPTSIAKFSKYQDEEEVLFPPFYPFKVLSVAEDLTTLSWNIKLLVPTHICLSSNKEYYTKAGYKFSATPQEYVKKACELVKTGLSDDLMFCKRNVVHYKLIPEVLLALQSKQPLRRFALEFENSIGVDEFRGIMKELVGSSSASLRHLSFADCHLSDVYIKCLAEFLPRFEKLDVLDLTWNKITAIGAADLAVAIKKLRMLTRLNLSSNFDIKAAGMKELAPALNELKFLHTLIISGTGLGNAGAVELAVVLKELKSLSVLDASLNELGPEGSIAIASAIKGIPTLTSLDFYGNCIGDEGAIPLADSLKCTKSMSSLQLNSTYMGSKGIAAMASALKGLTQITSFDFSQNALFKESAVALSMALKEMRSLTKLRLSEDKLGTEGAIALAPALSELKSLRELWICSNEFGDEGMKALAPAFKELKMLTILRMSSGKIGKEGAVALAGTMKELKMLKCFDISYNEIGDEGAIALAPSLKELTHLMELTICANKISAKGAASLVPAISALRSLTNFSIGENSLGPEGVIALAPALKAHKYLDTLWMNYTNMGDEGAIALASAVTGLTSLSDFHIGQNHIGPKGAVALAPAIKRFELLNTLNMRENAIGPEGMAALFPALKGLKCLVNFDVSENGLNVEGAKSLAETMKEVVSLRELRADSNRLENEGGKAIAAVVKELKSLTTLAVDYNRIDVGIYNEIKSYVQRNANQNLY